MANLVDRMKEWKINQVGAKRYSICTSCDKLVDTTKVCSVCYCFMPIKVRIMSSECPEGKWTKHDEQTI